MVSMFAKLIKCKAVRHCNGTAYGWVQHPGTAMPSTFGTHLDNGNGSLPRDACTTLQCRLGCNVRAGVRRVGISGHRSGTLTDDKRAMIHGQ